MERPRAVERTERYGLQDRASGTETVLYSFGASATDGQYPDAGLIMDSAGNLYGTTYAGGANSFGTVFKIAPGTERSLLLRRRHRWAYPEAGLIMDSAGNLYGTTYGWWSERLRYSLQDRSRHGNNSLLLRRKLHRWAVPVCGSDHRQRRKPLRNDLYGGANSYGTVFKIAAGTESVLYSFGASTADGQYPWAGLIMDSAGNLYGTTFGGGANDDGTVFKIAAGTESVLYSFGASSTDGQIPFAGLIMDSAGNLYGTTYGGGANGYGTVFTIASGKETVLYSFGANSTDGQNPIAGLIMDSAGNLYGTTVVGGANGESTAGDGTVFEID